MADTDAFDTVMAYLETSPEIDIDHVYGLMREHYGLTDVMYLEAERIGGHYHARSLECTHARNRAGPCFSAEGRVEDRALVMALQSFRPLDYDYVRRSAGADAYLTVTVTADDRPMQGLALPQACPPGRAAVLIVEAGMASSDWRLFLHRHQRDLQFIAILFHSALTDRSGAPARPDVTLTPRERAVVDATRKGRPAREIAAGLGMAEQMVGFFLKNGLRKLEAIGAGPPAPLIS